MDAPQKEVVVIQAVNSLQKFSVWFWFRHSRVKCTLECCKVSDYNASNMIVCDSQHELMPPGDERLKAQLKIQRKNYKDMFRKLGYIPPDDARLTLTLGSGPGSRDIVFEPTTIAMQMLNQAEFRFFAGMNNELLQQLLLTGTIHPDALPKKDTVGINYQVHSVNYTHLINRPMDHQKLLSILFAGRIVYSLGDTDDVAAIQAAKDAFHAVPFIRFDSTGKMTEVKLCNWEKHSDAFCKFFEATCASSPLTPLVNTLAKLRGIDGSTAENTREAFVRSVAGKRAVDLRQMIEVRARKSDRLLIPFPRPTRSQTPVFFALTFLSAA